MSLSTYNIIWKSLEKILPRYLEHRKKSGKEDIHRIHERYGNSKKIRLYHFKFSPSLI